MRNKYLKNILIILILFIAVLSVIIPKELNNLDELWNYNFARNVADGLLPYKDFNMVQTPLLPLICGLVLKLIFNELIVMRILATILITAILYVTYKIFEILKINKHIVNLLIIGIFLLFYKHFCIDYNFAILLVVLITIYYELKSLSNKKEILIPNKTNFLLGILVGTSILFKHTTGLFLSAIYIFYKLLIATNKEEFKNVFKIILLRLLGVMIPISIFAIYLTVNNIWQDFLDYTIYSLHTFKNKISYMNLIKGNYGFIIAILSLLVPIAIIGMYFISVCKTIKTEEQKNIFVLFSYSIAAFIVVYPISDSIHFLIGSLPSLIGLAYLMWLIFKDTLKDKKLITGIIFYSKAMWVLLTAVILVCSVTILTKYLNICTQYEKLEHFKYIPSSSGKIEKICEYITKQDEKVYILDATAAIYMIPINKYNKDYDMFLKGNLGAKDEEGIITNLEQENNQIIVLIMNEKYRRNWQNPEKVREYIINRWTKVGEIENFDIYQKESL